MTDSSGNGWDKHKKLVLHELERHDKAISNVHKEISAFRAEQATALSDLKVEVGKLSVKASMWGGVAGLMVALSVILLRMV